MEEEPEGDLIDLATEPWKTQRKTTSWHPQKSEENWVLTQADTGGKTKIQISRKTPSPFIILDNRLVLR